MSEGSKDEGFDPTGVIAKLLAKNEGDQMAVMSKLLDENHSLRAKNRDLRSQLKEAREAAPGEGVIVLSQEEGLQWNAFKEMGDPDSLKTAISERDEAKNELGAVKRNLTLRDAARLHGYDPDVLNTLAQDLHLEIKDATDEEGRAVKRAFVSNGDGDPVALETYATANWKKFETSLQGGEAQGGTKLLKQRGEGSEAKADIASTFLAKQEENRKPSPLARN